MRLDRHQRWITCSKATEKRRNNELIVQDGEGSAMIGIQRVLCRISPTGTVMIRRLDVADTHAVCIGGNVRRTCASVENEHETTAEGRPSTCASKRCSWEREREPSGEDVEPPAGSQTLAPRADASSKKPP